MTQHVKNNASIGIVRIIQRFVQALRMFKAPTFAHRFILAGIHIVSPQKKPSYSHDRIQLTNDLISYGLAINDVKDLERFVAQSDDLEIKKEYKQRYRQCKKLEQSLIERKDNIICRYIEDINSFENYIQTQKDAYWNFKTIKKARELMNAIHTSAIYATLVNFSNNYNQGNENKTYAKYQYLQKKYEWIMRGKARNSHENAIIILWNLAMNSQVPNDRIDKAIDTKCMLPTFATVLEKNNNKTSATITKKLNSLNKNYLENAKKHGYTHAFLHNAIFTTLFAFLKKLVLIGTQFPKPVREFFAHRFVFLRERLILTKKFDVKEKSMQHVFQYLLAASLPLIFDRSVKYYAKHSSRLSISINSGLIMGLLTDRNIAALSVSLSVLFALFLLSVSVIKEKYDRLLILLIISASVSNIIDRIFYPGVIDYISVLNLAQINLADIIITVSLLLLISKYLFPDTTTNHQ